MNSAQVEGIVLLCDHPIEGGTEGLSTPAPAPTLAVIVPCYNEEGNLPELVRRMTAALEMHRISFEIVLIDDKSGDGTATVIRELMKRDPRVTGAFHQRNLGISGGWRTGLEASRAPYIVITDADLQYAPEDVPRLYEILQRESCDIVQGWRIAHDFKGTYRFVLSLAFSFMLNRLLGSNLWDVKSGFLCTRREVFADMLQTRYQYRRPQHFIVNNALSKGYEIRQEPILFRKRVHGESFIRSPLRFAVGSLPDLPRAFWEFRALNRRRRQH